MAMVGQHAINKGIKGRKEKMMTTGPPITAKTAVSDNDRYIDGQIKDLANSLGRAEAAIDKLRSISETRRHGIRKQGTAA